MNKYEQAIIRYENARVSSVTIKKLHAKLISSCERVQCEEGNWNPLHDKTCGQQAWEEMREENAENTGYGERIEFEDAFYHSINHAEGACENCIKAFKLKQGKLAEANKEFGAAKRSLTVIGKGLIKNGGAK